MKYLVIMTIFFSVIVVSSGALGIGQSFEIPEAVTIDEPEGGNIFTAIIDGIKYMFSAIGALVNMVSFQVAGIPGEMIVLGIFPLIFGVFYLTLALLRGGR